MLPRGFSLFCAESVTTRASRSLFSHWPASRRVREAIGIPFGPVPAVTGLALCLARDAAGQVITEVSALGDVICLRHSRGALRDRIVQFARIAIMLGVDERYGHENTDQT